MRKIQYMDSEKSGKKVSTFWILNISGWFLLFIIYLFLYYRERLGNLKITLGLFITYFTGFLISLVLRYLYKKINYQSRSILSLATIVFIGSILASNVWYWMDLLFSIPLHGAGQLISRITIMNYVGSNYSHLWVLVLWSLLYFGIKLWREWMLQKERTKKAYALAQSAQLQMLRYQLNPHFLFNSLNSIRALIEEDKNQAKIMITELAEFLRYSLISKNYSDVPLNDEIEAIRHYFAIQQKRYEQKLEVTFEIDPLAEDYPVLSFLIHPLIENAIKYGMKTSPMPLKIRIKAMVKNETLKVEVSNTGKWVKPSIDKSSSEMGTGTGLENIRQRLENAFPDNYCLNIFENDESVCIQLEINKKLEHKNE